MKRLFDIIASFAGLILLSPVIITVALLIKIRMPGPIIFKQVRTGRYGNPFTMYKFRTMVIAHGGNSVSVKGENRITPLGATLRKSKLDELPELWNIVLGNMSFVGPRPDVPEYTDKLTPEEKAFLNIRPGLTSPASIKYVNEEELLAFNEDPQNYFDMVIWPDKVRLNLDYYYNRSFWSDLLIITGTIFRKGRS
jgi:lipopolysaccharide/colanic/teichoic acid biosynthesis glycosyltransferase